MSEVVLETRDLCKYYPVAEGFFRPQTRTVKAVDRVSIRISKGETLGLVGESGCGKTTISNTILRIVDPTSGRIYFKGKDISAPSKQELKELRQHMSVVFQDPFSSLDQRMRVKDIVGEPLAIHQRLTSQELAEKVRELLTMVGLSTEHANRYPRQFSGGQRQRIAIARAIATNPDLLILDEPTSALDVSVQAQILSLLKEIQLKFEMAFLFISHNLSVVKSVSDNIAVMYRGRVVEYSDSRSLFKGPLHPYTQMLIASVPVPVRNRMGSSEIKPAIDTNTTPTVGCVYNRICPYAMDICRGNEPEPTQYNESHSVYCYLYRS